MSNADIERAKMIDGKIDTRTWTLQKRLDEYRKLCKHEKQLTLLYRQTQELANIFKIAKVNANLIDNAWYGVIRPRLIELVGHGAIFTDEPSLMTMRAYDVAYETLVDLLHDPELFDKVDKPKGQFTAYRASDLMNAPNVRGRREGHDLVIENWFNPKALR